VVQQLQSKQQGKEGVLLPLRLQAPAVQQLQQLPPHAGEVQVRLLSTTQLSVQEAVAAAHSVGAAYVGPSQQPTSPAVQPFIHNT
jgi:hypothetical protein